MNAYYLSILQGSLLTVAVSLCSLVVAVVLGLLGAAARLSGRPVAVALGTVYTSVIRGIPDLVLMLLVFYGGTMGLNHLMELMGSKRTVDINPFVAGVLTLGFIYGAYMTETFRGAILAIPKGQSEAAWAFGMGRTVRTQEESRVTAGSRFNQSQTMLFAFQNRQAIIVWPNTARKNRIAVHQQMLRRNRRS